MGGGTWRLKMFKNCTPHDINIVCENGEIKTFPRTGNCVRVAVITSKIATIEGVAIFKENLGEVVGLPQEQDGVFLIVSRLVADAALKNSARKDLVVPSGLVRNDVGEIKGCTGFIRVVKEGL